MSEQEIEPTAWLFGDGTIEKGAYELLWPDEVTDEQLWFNAEPLYTLSRITTLIDELKHIDDRGDEAVLVEELKSAFKDKDKGG